MPPMTTAGATTADIAVLMLMLGEKTAAEVMKNLSPAEVQHLGAAMYAVENVEEADLDRILESFLIRLATETGIGFGTPAYVRGVITEALGPDRAQSVISRISPNSADRPIELLDWMDARAVSELIADEHPQIMALVVACLEYQQAAEVLLTLPEDVQADVVRRIAQLNSVTPEALRDLEQVLQRKFKTTSSSSASQIGGIKAAARIMNFTRAGAEARILRDIRKDDKDLMTQLQDNMFVFDNLGRSDDRSLQTLLRAIEPEQLVLALKGADEVLRDRLLGCMSARAAANIQDEIQALGPVRLTEVQEAQKQIVSVARTMADAGTIVLAGRGGEEMV